MVALRNGFDANNVEPDTPLEALPAGEYEAMITDTNEKPTAKRDGSFIEVEMTVSGGKFDGRKLWDRLNLNNPSQKAVEIAERTLSAICHATGVMNLEDTEQLHGKVVVARVVVKTEAGYAPKNEVKSYKPPERKGRGSGTSRPGYGQRNDDPPKDDRRDDDRRDDRDEGRGREEDRRDDRRDDRDDRDRRDDDRRDDDRRDDRRGDDRDDRGGYDDRDRGDDRRDDDRGAPSGQPNSSAPPWRKGR